MRVVAYCRVSTEEEEQVKSFNEQQEHFKYYCAEKGYNLLKTYADRGRSGKNVDREQFQEMLYDAGLDVTKQKKGNKYNFELSDRIPLFDYILVKDVSRFSRNTGDGVQIVSQLREKGVHILFEANGIDTKDISGNASNVSIVLNMLFSTAESESQMTSLRLKKANLSRLERGIFTIRTLPYGYRKNEAGEVVQVEEQAKAVRYIFERAKFVGLRTIGMELEAQGIKPLKARIWAFNVLKSILSNTMYYGTATALKRKTEQLTSIRKKTDESERKYIPNVVKEPIVTYEQWKEANDALASRRNEDGKGNKPCEVPNIFSRKLICGYCGSKLTRNSVRSSTGKSLYNYVCQARRERGTCEGKNLSYLKIKSLFDSVEPTLIAKGFGFANTDEIILEKIQFAKENIEGSIRATEEELYKTEKKIRNIQMEILDAESLAVKQDWKLMLGEVVEYRNDVERKIHLLKSNKLDNLIKKTKAIKKKIVELSTTTFTEEMKLTNLNFITVYDERVVIHFNAIGYQEVIEELNKYLPIEMHINSTVEMMKAEHEVFKSEKLRIEHYENQQQS